MAGYWPRSLFRFYELDFVFVHKKAKKEVGPRQYLASLTSRLVNNAYV